MEAIRKEDGNRVSISQTVVGSSGYSSLLVTITSLIFYTYFKKESTTVLLHAPMWFMLVRTYNIILFYL